MRILFAMPHYYDPKGGGRYGSLKATSAPRRNALVGAIFSLHATFGRRQGLLMAPPRPCNSALANEIEIVVCTTAGRHLLDELRLPPGFYTHQPTEAKPMYLGYECHEVLRRNLGRFDYYCYLEDDIALLDPLFFAKQEWFNRLAGDEALLQPNRNEVAIGQGWHKLYVDGNLTRPEWSSQVQDVTDRPAIEAEAFGLKLRFQRVNNPHAGCFFLNARQMARWAAQPDFLGREAIFVGPLESAATLGLMRHFRVYKPAQESAGFLEARHLDHRYLGVRRVSHAAAAGPA